MKRFFGWLFLTKNYMATLSDEEIALRCGVTSTRSGYIFERSDRILAAAHASILLSQLRLAIICAEIRKENDL